MAVCTFFGHKDCPDSIAPLLQAVMESLIEHDTVTTFLVGNHGRFDALVRSVLSMEKKRHPKIEYAVVLAYMPKEKPAPERGDLSDTILPEGIERVPPRFAISWRNNWMLRQADYVITYIVHPWGKAVSFAEQAKKLHKHVINLADWMDA